MNLKQQIELYWTEADAEVKKHFDIFVNAQQVSSQELNARIDLHEAIGRRAAFNKVLDLLEQQTTGPTLTITVKFEKSTNRHFANVHEYPGLLVYGVSKEHAIARAKAEALSVAADCLEHAELEQLGKVAPNGVIAGFNVIEE